MSKNCHHHYNSLITQVPQRMGGNGQWGVRCLSCRVEWPVIDEQDAANFIMNAYRHQTGNQNVVYADMFGTPYEIGSRVVYPVTHGSNTQLVEALVEGWTGRTQPGRYSQPIRLDAPARLKVRRTGHKSRAYYLDRDDHDTGVVTLKEGAMSAVVIL